jgi:hypothetical protein
VKGVSDVLSLVHFRGWPSIIKRDADVLMLLHFETFVVVFLCYILKLLLLRVYFFFAWERYDSSIEVVVIFSIVKRVLSLLLLRMNLSYCLTLENLNTQRILNLHSFIYINYAYMVIINIEFVAPDIAAAFKNNYFMEKNGFLASCSLMGNGLV